MKKRSYFIPILSVMRSDTYKSLACLGGSNPAGVVTKGLADVNCGVGGGPACGGGSGVLSAGSCGNGPADAKAYFIAPAQCIAGTRFSNNGTDCDAGGAPHAG